MTPPWSSVSVLDHRSLPPVFESGCGHIWRLFRLSLRLITFGGRSAHLAYHVHKSGRKTSIIIIIVARRAAQLYARYRQFAIVSENILYKYCSSFAACRCRKMLHKIKYQRQVLRSLPLIHIYRSLHLDLVPVEQLEELATNQLKWWTKLEICL